MASGNVLKVSLTELMELSVSLKEQRGPDERDRPKVKIRAGGSSLVGKIARMSYGPMTLKGHKKRSYRIAFSRDGRRLVSGSWDKTVKIWDALSVTRPPK